MTDQFDPSAHTVAETQEHLAKADTTERERVQALEAEGANRKGIVEWMPTADDVEPDADGYTRVPVDAYQPGEPIERDDEGEDSDTEV